MTREEIFYAVFSIAVLVIGYFLRSIHVDFKNATKMQQQERENNIRLDGEMKLLKQTLDNDRKAQAEKLERLETVINKQTSIIEDMNKMVIHLDKNSTGIKMFFDKYEKVDDKQIELEKRVAHLEAMNENQTKGA